MKLAAYCLDENCIKLMKSYLIDRKQRTNLQGSKSCYRDLTYSVPQGSIIGPLLFIIYTYDLSILRKFLSHKTTLLLYKVMILPHFEYVDLIIDSAAK